MHFARLQAFLATFLLAPGLALAQQVPEQPPAPPVLSNPAPAGGSAVTPASRLFDFFGTKTPYEFWLTLCILAAGLIFLAMAIWILKQTDGGKVEHVTRALTIILVIIGTMVLITAGYNNEQIAPAFGLFGTIVGYILGRSQTREEERDRLERERIALERQGAPGEHARAERVRPAAGER
ncbi:hypothetical protein [Afifella sp. IM 167]|uniref:hypothetical protein n=1 Tax=Afifella sp. IM 167 TaxID=2033586 RepID=UPI001CCD174C|nr:hypothetical protein [Afifella sp. IM 167]MBZ8133955.1 hypothetical protein [Afifella sp. IM 167]